MTSAVWNLPYAYSTHECVMSSSEPMVTADNYQSIRARIQREAGRYRLNVERWALGRFQHFSKRPNPDAIQALEAWMRDFLPAWIRREIIEAANPKQEGCSAAEPHERSMRGENR